MPRALHSHAACSADARAARRPFRSAGGGLQRARRRTAAPAPPRQPLGRPFDTLHFNALFSDAGASPRKAPPERAPASHVEAADLGGPAVTGQ